MGGTELICKRVARRKNAFVSGLVLGVIAAHAIKQAVLDIAKTGKGKSVAFRRPVRRLSVPLCNRALTWQHRMLVSLSARQLEQRMSAFACMDSMHRRAVRSLMLE